MRHKRAGDAGAEPAGRGRRWAVRGATAGLLAGVMLVAGACSSSSTSPTSTASPTSTTSTTTSASGAPSVSRIETELAAGAPTFLATYNFTNTGSSATPSGSYVVAHEGSDELISIDSSPGRLEQVVLGSKTYVCAQLSTGWQCFFGPASKDLGLEFSKIFGVVGTAAALAALRADSAGATTSTGTVDGRAVVCAHSTTSSKTVTVCVLADGVLAEFESQSSSGTTKVVLSSFSSSVPSDEFMLPATPTTLPSVE